MSEDGIITFDPQNRQLQGKKGIVLGVANRDSIAYGCAAAFRFLGAELALTYLNEKAKRFVEPIAEELEAPIFLPCNVEKEGELEAVFAAAERRWGKIDFALHSIAFAPREDLRTAAWSTRRPRASPKRWTSRATRSSAWPGSPSR